MSTDLITPPTAQPQYGQYYGSYPMQPTMYMAPGYYTAPGLHPGGYTTPFPQHGPEVGKPGTTTDQNISFPSILQWFTHLDNQAQWCRSKLLYSTLVDKFQINGFDRLDRVVLDTTIMSLTDFHLALNIPIGIASSILKYAKEDIEAICAGKLHFPQENDNPSNDDGVE
jgi:hypothetical protein